MTHTNGLVKKSGCCSLGDTKLGRETAAFMKFVGGSKTIAIEAAVTMSGTVLSLVATAVSINSA